MSVLRHPNTEKDIEMAKNNIKNDDIKLLKGEERVRKRPEVIFGSNNINGCIHAVFEIISNSVDEAREGYGDKVIITVNNDSSISVEDFGRGIPLDYNPKEKRYNWDLIFCELYAGGKYDNNSDEGMYQYAIGLNGLGACATQYASEYMKVESHTGGFAYEMNFKKGKPVGELIKRELQRKEKKTGTKITWRPDLAVFTDIKLPFERISDMLHRQSVVNTGLRFELNWQNEDGEYEQHVYEYAEGIREYVREIAGEDAITQPVSWSDEAVGKDREDLEPYRLKFEVAFCFAKTTSRLEYYHNSSFLEYGGSTDKAVKLAFSAAIEKYSSSVSKSKANSRISFADIEESLVIVVNSFSTVTSYENQTKKSITNKFIQDYINAFLKRNLEIYFKENSASAEAILKQVTLNRKGREAAETAKINVTKVLNAPMDITSKIEKFIDCRARKPEDRELYIVEGDSAASSCKLARDAMFQAIMPVRGKTLNCLKSTPEQILKSQIIVDLLRVIGCGAELRMGKKADSAFDASKLNFSKIIICTDADEDGFQIRTLILTMFYRLLPTLIKDGKVYIAETPLYEITSGTNTYFAYDENEKAEILKKIGNKKVTLQRSKGLGENKAEMMKQTTMDPATRRLIRVCPTDEARTYEIFDTLLGTNIDARKKFVMENGARYMKDIDV